MDTARTTPRGHVQANVAQGVFLPVGAALTLITAGKDAGVSATKRKPTDAEMGAIADAAIPLALTPPGALFEIALRSGIVEDLDVGLRYATTSVKLDVKYRFFHSGDDAEASKHASIGFGASKYLFKNPIFDLLERVKIDDFSRFDLDFPVRYSWEFKEAFAFYAGAKYQLTRFTFSEKLFQLQEDASANGAPSFVGEVKSTMHYFGGSVGIMAGYKYAFVALELNGGYFQSSPSYFSFQTGKIEEHKVGGVTLYPAIGLVFRI